MKTAEQKNKERFERYYSNDRTTMAPPTVTINTTKEAARMTKKNKLYDYKFEDLFDSKQQAVTSFLSLERRHLELHHQYREFRKQVGLDYNKKPEPECVYEYTPFKPVGE